MSYARGHRVVAAAGGSAVAAPMLVQPGAAQRASGRPSVGTGITVVPEPGDRAAVAE